VTTKIGYDDVRVGMRLPEKEIKVRRIDLLRFAGACADFTPTHWNERIAKSVGLPNVIAHGTYTIAEAVSVVTDWAGDPGALVEYQARRFARPVVVPDDAEGATLHVGGVVKEKLPGGQVVVRLLIRSGEHEVVSGGRAVVQFG
jgi:acyl dehydratase